MSAFINKARKICIISNLLKNSSYFICFVSNSCYFPCFLPIGLNFLWFLSERESYSTLNDTLPTDLSTWREEYVSYPKVMTQRITKTTLPLQKVLNLSRNVIR